MKLLEFDKRMGEEFKPVLSISCWETVWDHLCFNPNNRYMLSRLVLDIKKAVRTK